jgi:pimeloyl-ACP methyl ester carboxylesterase
VTAEGLSALGPRVALFVHGLACDERSWDLRGEAWADTAWSRLLPAQQPVQYGALLERELGISPIFLRYNTGLSIETNARELAALLARAAHAAPQVDEWLLVGHSMGGLVARRAHDIATDEQFNWAPHAPLVVCLGSPHQGARLEQLGHLAARALDSTAVTRPLGRAANARSRGIKDLRSRIRRPAAPTKNAALRLVYGTLGEASGGAIGPLLGRWLGDGLVLPASAGDAGQAGDVERVELAGLGHMQLLNHPRVYAKLRRWFGAD